MGKNRVRFVGVSNWRSSPTRPVLTSARVGIYGYIHTIYIRPYGTRDTTLTPWISKNHLFTGSQAHRVTGLPSYHLPPKPQTTGSQAHRVTDSQAHHWHLGTLALAPWHWHSTEPLGSPSHRLMCLGSHRLPIFKPVKHQLAFGR